MRYELIAASTNGGTDYLLVRDGKVISRWVELDQAGKYDRLARSTVYTDLSLWDDQAASGADMSDYQDDLKNGRYARTNVLSVEIDGQQPGHIAREAVMAAVETLGLPNGTHTPVSYADGVMAVKDLIIDGTLPSWYGPINFYAKQAAEHAAKSLGVWPSR